LIQALRRQRRIGSVKLKDRRQGIDLWNGSSDQLLVWFCCLLSAARKPHHLRSCSV